ncbi:hypothetical protein AAY473_022928 [Plecturocebus cupreus]
MVGCRCPSCPQAATLSTAAHVALWVCCWRGSGSSLRLSPDLTVGALTLALTAVSPDRLFLAFYLYAGLCHTELGNTDSYHLLCTYCVLTATIDYVPTHFGRLRLVDHLRSGVRDQPGQHGETLPPLKIQKLARCGSRHLYSQLLRKLRQENYLIREAEVAARQKNATEGFPRWTLSISRLLP